MNKTININLAGMFFHIDEDAYIKLQRYLEAIKRSFTDPQGRDEIITDIEARIAELFTEKMQHDKQVISSKEVDEVITVMGQPEDYLLDEVIFNDQPEKENTNRKYKQLFRDIEDKYIGGVSSGLGHYLNIDALWIRLLFIFLAVFSGFGIIMYILFWILIPGAATTSQKLAMKGEPVNISNIEKKIKESLETVSKKVKNVDYDKVGDRVKKTSKGFFEGLGDIFSFFFKVFAKLVGIILIIIGAIILIGLFIGFLTIGITDMIHVPGIDFITMFNATETPIWLISIMTFFAVGIPFFFLFYLGLKILVENLNTIGNVAKFSLLGLWLLALSGLIVMGAIQASEHAYKGSISKTESLHMPPTDTLNIKMVTTDPYDNRFYSHSEFDVIIDDHDNKKIYIEDVIFDIKVSEDSQATIKIKKEAEGRAFKNARERAENIEYRYTEDKNTLKLNNFLTTSYKHRYRDQKVGIVLYIPPGRILKLDKNTHGNIGRQTKNRKNDYPGNLAGHSWKMGNDGILLCLDCKEVNPDDDESDKIIIDEKGINIDINDGDDSFEMKINTDGIKVRTTS